MTPMTLSLDRLAQGGKKPPILHIVVNGEKKPLIIFPNADIALKAVNWCQQKEMDSREAANALIAHCKKQGAKQIGRKLPKRFLEFAGIKCFKVEAENLTPKKGG